MDLTVNSPLAPTAPSRDFADVPLAAVLRGDRVGSLHRGIVTVCDASSKTVLALGDAEQRVFLRSAAKPFQVMPAILADALGRFGISTQELAVLCGSHIGRPQHQTAVLSVLDKIGLSESDLRCGTHPPLDEETSRLLWAEGRAATPACNNCSGAHAGMLVACVAHGWPIENYGSPDHPLQMMTRDIVAGFAGLARESVYMARDNCAVPTFCLPMRSAAAAFARLSTGEVVGTQLAGAATLVVTAMTSFPEMVAGVGRLDTQVMGATGGAIVCKSGAEGFQGIGLLNERLGIAVKITDGNSRALPPVVIKLLEHVGALSTGARNALQEERRPLLLNLQGEVVGQVQPAFDLP